MKQRRSFVFRCDASPRVGLGHLMRCVALAEELQNRHFCQIIFAMCDSELGVQFIQEKKMIVRHAVKNAVFDYEQWFDSIMEEFAVEVVVLDVRDDFPRNLIKKWQLSGVKFATIDDSSERRRDVDMAFYPPVPQLAEVDWDGFNGSLYVGWDWIILRKEFCTRCLSETKIEDKRLLIAMGGSDPFGLSAKILRALEESSEEYAITLVMGRGMIEQEAVFQAVQQSKHVVEVAHDVRDMTVLMQQARLAIVAFGMTAYELAAMRVPALYVAISEDHYISSLQCVEAGFGLPLGLASDLNEKSVCKAIDKAWKALLEKQDNAFHFSQAIDGQGVLRIAEKLLYC